MSDRSSDDNSDSSNFFGGINNLVDRLTELAEAAESLEESAETGSTAEDSNIDGVWGVRVRSAVGGEDVEFSEFGNFQEDDDGDTVVVDELREPMVDIFEEEESLLVVAEMPGAAPDDLDLEIDGDLMVVGAETESVNYRRELQLPVDCSDRTPELRANNGIFEIRLPADSA